MPLPPRKPCCVYCSSPTPTSPSAICARPSRGSATTCWPTPRRPQALPRVVESERPDVVIIDTESPSRDTLEQLAVMNETAPRPVLMFSNDADQQLIRAAVGAGVTAYLVEGLATERLAPILEVALARFAQE